MPLPSQRARDMHADASMGDAAAVSKVVTEMIETSGGKVDYVEVGMLQNSMLLFCDGFPSVHRLG